MFSKKSGSAQEEAKNRREVILMLMPDNMIKSRRQRLFFTKSQGWSFSGHTGQGALTQQKTPITLNLLPYLKVSLPCFEFITKSFKEVRLQATTMFCSATIHRLLGKIVFFYFLLSQMIVLTICIQNKIAKLRVENVWAKLTNPRN